MRLRLCGIAVLASCATAPPPDAQHVSGACYDGMIFSAAFAQRTRYGRQREMWTPTRKMVAEFERRVAPRLPADRNCAERRWPSRRHYVGLYEPGTHRQLIYVDLLCPNLYMEKAPVIPDLLYYGPEECSCGAWYDPANNRIVAFACGKQLR